jgi:Ribosomal protein L7/L12 C-terminal domain
MSPQIRQLPQDALLALAQGNKIEAIKIVRQADGSDLKSAKDAVEACIAADPDLQLRFAGSQGSALRAVVVAAAIVAAVVWLILSHRY